MSQFLHMHRHDHVMQQTRHKKFTLTDHERDLEMLFQALKTEIEERWKNPRKAFLALDRNRDGVVDAKEVQEQLAKWNIFPPLEDIANMLR